MSENGGKVIILIFIQVTNKFERKIIRLNFKQIIKNEIIKYQMGVTIWYIGSIPVSKQVSIN